MKGLIKLETILEAIDKQGLTQYDVAEGMEVGQSYVSAFLAGQKGISFTNLLRLLDMLHLNLSDVMIDDIKDKIK